MWRRKQRQKELFQKENRKEIREIAKKVREKRTHQEVILEEKNSRTRIRHAILRSRPIQMSFDF